MQKRAVDYLVENGGTVGKAMRKAGFSKKTAHTPQKLTESKGFKELCVKAGLTDNFLLEALVDDIEGKPKRRFKELELGFKVLGRLNPEGTESKNQNIVIMISGDASARYVNSNAPMNNAPSTSADTSAVSDSTRPA